MAQKAWLYSKSDRHYNAVIKLADSSFLRQLHDFHTANSAETVVVIEFCRLRRSESLLLLT